MHTELVWAWARPIVTMSSLTTGAGHWPQLGSRPGDTALCTTCSSQDSINRPVLPCKASYAHWSASSVMIGREGGMMTASTHSVSVPWHETGHMIHIMTWLLVIVWTWKYVCHRAAYYDNPEKELTNVWISKTLNQIPCLYASWLFSYGVPLFYNKLWNWVCYSYPS